MSTVRTLLGIGILAASAAGQAGAADFIRGDTNDDGMVSIADAYHEVWYMFGGGDPPGCFAALDADGNDKIDLHDYGTILAFLLDPGAPPILPPYPEPGPDPSGTFPCEVYGGGSTIDDPAAELAIVSAIAHGGTDRLATITIATSSSHSLAGLRGRIRDEGGVLEDFPFDEACDAYPHVPALPPGQTDPSNHTRCLRLLQFNEASCSGGLLGFGALVTSWFMYYLPIPAGDRVEVLQVLACLKPGTKAGEYPLVLEAGDLVSQGLYSLNVGKPMAGRLLDLDRYPANARAIIPALASGVLRVEEDVAGEGTTCETCVPVLDFPEARYKFAKVLFHLGDATGYPGQPVSIPFVLRADRASIGFSYSVDFDETLLEATGLERLWEKPSGTPYEFEVYDMDNRDDVPGNSGIEEGYVTGAAIFSLTDTDDVLPAWTEVEALRLDFRVRLEAPSCETEIRFQDGGLRDGEPVTNKLYASGGAITPATFDSFLLVSGRVTIVPDVTLFVRGDSNDDEAVDLSDPIFTLAFLFLGGPAPLCGDAADANDDGKIDLTDPVSTLTALFLGDVGLGGGPVRDLTPDALGCGSY